MIWAKSVGKRLDIDERRKLRGTQLTVISLIVSALERFFCWVSFWSSLDFCSTLGCFSRLVNCLVSRSQKVKRVWTSCVSWIQLLVSPFSIHLVGESGCRLCASLCLERVFKIDQTGLTLLKISVVELVFMLHGLHLFVELIELNTVPCHRRLVTGRLVHRTLIYVSCWWNFLRGQRGTNIGNSETEGSWTCHVTKTREIPNQVLEWWDYMRLPKSVLQAGTNTILSTLKRTRNWKWPLMMCDIVWQAWQIVTKWPIVFLEDWPRQKC